MQRLAGRLHARQSARDESRSRFGKSGELYPGVRFETTALLSRPTAVSRRVPACARVSAWKSLVKKFEPNSHASPGGFICCSFAAICLGGRELHRLPLACGHSLTTSTRMLRERSRFTPVLLLRHLLLASAAYPDRPYPERISAADRPTGGGGTSRRARLRIAYITNAWWPKIDGAAITVEGHVAHFVAQGHPVLVVRPAYPSHSPLLDTRSSREADPLPQRLGMLEYISYPVSGFRGGGYEPSLGAGGFAAVERGLVRWAPDVLLVTDPEMFLFDAYRLPGFNSLMRRAVPPVAIACFTSFTIEAVLKMPEFWWMQNRPLTSLFVQGLTYAYARFDHVFVSAAGTFALGRRALSLGTAATLYRSRY